MMSERRQARAGASTAQHNAAEAPDVDLLRNREALVWHDGDRYRRWMAERSWSLPASERFGVASHPANRRNYAARQWAVANGVVIAGQPHHADLGQLRRLGLGYDS